MSTNTTTMAMIAMYAPCVNLVMSTTTSTVAVITRPTELMTRERFIRARVAGSGSVRRCRVQCRTMPELAHRERHEHADDVELDQAGDLARRTPR